MAFRAPGWAVAVAKQRVAEAALLVVPLRCVCSHHSAPARSEARPLATVITSSKYNNAMPFPVCTDCYRSITEAEVFGFADWLEREVE